MIFLQKKYRGCPNAKFDYRRVVLKPAKLVFFIAIQEFVPFNGSKIQIAQEWIVNSTTKKTITTRKKILGIIIPAGIDNYIYRYEMI
jgi:hypothetical protein